MWKFLYISCLSLFLMTTDNFKEEQLRYPRVREAYSSSQSDVNQLLKENNIGSKFQIYLRAFKQEKKIELYAKNPSDSQYKLIKTYDICRLSGTLGAKRKQGDLQIPEGYYSINRFNPNSNFYLSLGLNYPNKSDRILGEKGRLGGDIFIHGACVTIGCLPITDKWIKELYVFCVEAKDGGQNKIPVTIFPCELTDKKFQNLKNEYSGQTDKIGLWEDLKKGFDIFNQKKQLPNIQFLKNGRHNII